MEPDRLVIERQGPAPQQRKIKINARSNSLCLLHCLILSLTDPNKDRSEQDQQKSTEDYEF